MGQEKPPRIPPTLPVLPLRDMVVYPLGVIPVLVGQERSVRLVEDVMQTDRMIALVTQIKPEARPAGPDDVYRVGTAAVIHQILRSPDGTIRLVAQGLERIRLSGFTQTEPYLIAAIQRAPEVDERGVEVEALSWTLRDLFQRLVSLVPELPDELGSAVRALTGIREMTYLIASSAPLTSAERQQILELDSNSGRMRRLVELLQHHIAVRELETKIAAETHEQISKSQREFILRERLRTIQRELGEGGEELSDLREKLAKAPLTPDAREEGQRELDRLERIPMASPEHGLIRTYLDWLLTLPWGKSTGGAIEIARARAVLDEDHYDLEKIKERILEHLAVKKLRAERRIAAQGERSAEPILCFVGPPGTGKTSLGQSIARAMGRQFVRISLGGIHDEAEVRGHRRTYIGAMPGRILQALRRIAVADPIFMLDEIDKLGVGFHGDPSAALLEVLDPAQNHAFVDTYLGVPFDLSPVFFICTANTTDTIPPALLDRMEVLTLSGYTEAEKRHIARRHILPKLLPAHGLAQGELVLEEGVIRQVIRDYTREAGVRNLERELAGLARKAARRMTEGAQPPVRVTAEAVREYLGRPRFFDELAERIVRPGVATGLAWTPVGGDVLFVEAALMPGQEEKLVLTGMLGDVMRESAQAALTYLRSNAERLGIDPQALAGKLVHVHVPAGAVPKDGPSAGVTMAVALASAASGRLVRNDVAMTGEVTLRGKVLRVGGVKDKVLAAHRAGVKTVILPRASEGDLEEVPEEVRSAMQFAAADTVEEVLAAALAPREIGRAEIEQPALH